VVRYILPWPVSQNHLYLRSRNGQVRLSDKARAWREEAIIRVRQSGERPPAGALRVNLRLWGPRGHWDADNISKATLDAVFAAVGRDDADVMELELRKMPVQATRPVVEVEIGELRWTGSWWQESPELPSLEQVGVRA
jgi:Holliday junction resolvase RusA-like endonuclease